MKMLLAEGLLHGDALTVTGESLAANLRDTPEYPNGQDIVRGFLVSVKRDSHLVILYGNLAPEGAVAKISGKEGERFTGKAIVFDREEAALDGDSSRAREERPRRRHPLRRTARRTGDARDAFANERDHGAGAG